MTFIDTKAKILNRGTPPDSFLTELVEWAKSAPDELFDRNPSIHDVFTHIRPILAPDGWQNLSHRKAAMLEAIRVHAGFESSWHWNEGVDVTNRTSMANIEGQETGAWQVSFDSTRLAKSLADYAKLSGIGTPQAFIPAMKSNHTLAMDYYARLIRVTVAWAGPFLRHEIDKWLSKDAVQEFRELLKPTTKQP